LFTLLQNLVLYIFFKDYSLQIDILITKYTISFTMLHIVEYIINAYNENCADDWLTIILCVYVVCVILYCVMCVYVLCMYIMCMYIMCMCIVLYVCIILCICVMLYVCVVLCVYYVVYVVLCVCVVFFYLYSTRIFTTKLIFIIWDHSKLYQN
jgi:hypothetical protein